MSKPEAKKPDNPKPTSGNMADDKPADALKATVTNEAPKETPKEAHQESAPQGTPGIVPPSPTPKYPKLEVANLYAPMEGWPPPLYIRPEATEREKQYINNRWFSQWTYYDKSATRAKEKYLPLQTIVAVCSAVVPVMVGVKPVTLGLEGIFSEGFWTLITLILSLAVAIAAALDKVMKYGDTWRDYRAAAEELMREKNMYDALSGPYYRTKRREPFLLFCERCEDIFARQNEKWVNMQRNELQTDQDVKDTKPNDRSEPQDTDEEASSTPHAQQPDPLTPLDPNNMGDTSAAG